MWNMLLGTKGRKAKCQICEKESELISAALKVKAINKQNASIDIRDFYKII